MNRFGRTSLVLALALCGCGPGIRQICTIHQAGGGRAPLNCVGHPVNEGDGFISCTTPDGVYVRLPKAIYQGESCQNR